MFTIFIMIVLLTSAAVQLTFQLVSWFVFYRIIRYMEKENENANNRKPNPHD